MKLASLPANYDGHRSEAKSSNREMLRLLKDNEALFATEVTVVPIESESGSRSICGRQWQWRWRWRR